MPLQLSHFFSPLSPSVLHPSPSSTPHPYSDSWVIHINSLASPFPIPFLTSPVCFLPMIMLLIPCTFSLVPAYNPPPDLHFYDSFPVLVVCLVCFCFSFLGSVVDSCEFVVISLFIFLIIFFILGKSR